MAQDDSLAGIINKKSLPTALLVFAGLLLFISFFVGWFSVDAELRRWQYDPDSEDHLGSPIGKANLDLEMKMLSLGVTIEPDNIQELMEDRGGPPTYEDAAGASGTVMRGVLLLQVATTLCFFALLGFYALQRKRKTDYSRIVKRLYVLFVILTLVTIAYFSFRIVPAAEEDEKYIINEFSLSDDDYNPNIEPDIGFFIHWETKPAEYSQGTERQMWKFTVMSGPSGGWYLSLIAFGCVTAARIIGARNGDLTPKDEDGPAPPPPLAPPPPPKWTRV